jgi:putative sterol carrier protein
MERSIPGTPPMSSDALRCGEVERPDTIMILGETDWLAFVEGTLDPVNACMMGKLKVTGDVLFAARLQALFAQQ